MIKCSKCEVEKDEFEFGKDKSKKLGRSSQCKECQKIYLKKYRNDPKNLVIAEEYRKEWYKKNSTPELRHKYYSKCWESEEFRKKQYIRMKKWGEENPNYSKEWYDKNKNNPAFKLRAYTRNRIYECVKKYQYNKLDTTLDALGCSISHYIKHIESKWSDDMHWGNHGEYWEIDHIHPLSKGGSFHYTNTQPLTKIENRKKGDKIL